MTLKEIRNEAGLTQIEACKKLNITIRHLSFIENDRRSPSIKLIERMSRIYGRKPEEIFLAARRTYCSKNTTKELNQ